MIEAPLPTNEAERLAALREYQILDTESERAYDDITLLASTICQVPTALVSLVDQDRQWFKSRVGFATVETKRNISFCGHAINGRDTFVVHDASEDHRFADNPLVTNEPRIRFYAAAPLVNPGGYAVGTLCVLDHQPRDLSRTQLSALEALGRLVVDQLELRKVSQLLQKNFRELQQLSHQAEKQQVRMIHSAKMASLGEMAAGIAHEINNPLTIIAGKASVTRLKLASKKIAPEDVDAAFATIERVVERASTIIRGLHSFSRDGARDSRSNVLIDEILDDVIALLGRRCHHEGVRIDTPPRSALRVSVRSVEVAQVIFNLMTNALDAVTTAAVTGSGNGELGDGAWIKLEWAARDKMLEIRVSNSGPPIPAEIRDRIMHPFFTTKPVGKGTGLGLSIARGLTESNRGTLTLDQTQPVTTFVLTLPLAES